jgi:hypothetical protein
MGPTDPIPLPPQARLRALFSYDPEEGILRRRLPNGTERPCRGRQVLVDGVLYYISRIVWKWAYGIDPAGVIDHENHDVTDHRLDNLRDVSQQQNSTNRKLRSDNRSGVPGVSREGNRWRASIMHQGKRTSLGSFETLKEAAEAYETASRELQPLAWTPGTGRGPAVLPSTAEMPEWPKRTSPEWMPSGWSGSAVMKAAVLPST